MATETVPAAAEIETTDSRMPEWAWMLPALILIVGGLGVLLLQFF